MSIDDEDRTTAIGLFTFADSFLKSARALEKANLRIEHPAPIQFLFYHSIELYLKSFLRLHYSAEDLRNKFGHRMKRLKKKAAKNGMPINEIDVAVLDIIDDTDAIIDSRYISTGRKILISPEMLDRTALRIRASAAGALEAEGHTVRRI